MRIGFWGTPELASECLKSLKEEYDVKFAVTQIDKPSGRNLKLTPCPVKQTALELSIDVLQPEKLTDPEFIQKLKEYDVDIYVIVAYGKIIPRSVYELPRLKTINLHPSLLPAYRGAAPIQWALINGETKTGVTVQLINERMDAGDIVIQEEILLDDFTDAGELYQKVIPVGIDLLKKAIVLLNEGQVKPIIQDENKATYCSKIDKDMAKINWNDNAQKIHNLVRGLNPLPGTWTTINDKLIKIKKTIPVCIENLNLAVGEIEFYQKKRLIIGTGKGLLEILYIQPETKKVMDALSFINGHYLYKNMRFC